MTPESAYSAIPGASLQDPVLPDGTSLLNGQYKIERYLSSGGFGVTYLARDSLDRQVVIKECYPEAICTRSHQSVVARTTAYQGEFGSLIAMFVREARNLAQLRHPNIVGVHQVFENFGTAYMALDLVEGQDLLTMTETEKNPFTPGKIKKLLLKLLDAIATVHDHDMLHRDISPDNILVDVWGNPVLIDFGAAREQASKKSRAVSQLMVVKDGYSPQEFYISGSRQGPFSDIYSLAASFYHLITGEAPIDSQTRLAALAAKRPDPCLPLSGRIPGYESSFLSAIDQAMAVFPPDRIQSAREWVTLIDAKQRRAAAEEHSLSQAELQKVIAEMVVEVEESIARSIAIQKEAEAAPPPPEPERVLEYLSPPEPEPQPVAQVQPSQPCVSICANLLMCLQCLLPSRPVAFASMLAAISFHIVENPDSNVTTVAAPEVQRIISIGREMTNKTTEFLTAAL